MRRFSSYPVRPAVAALMAVAAWLAFPPGASAQDVFDGGDFLLQFAQGSTEEEAILSAILEGDDDLYELISDVNETVKLPTSVPVQFGPGNEGEVYYDPGETRIYISFGFIQDVMQLFRDNGDFDPENPDAEIAAKILPVVYETVLHEMAHALIHLHGIPTHGQSSEEVADQLVVFIVSDFYGDDETIDAILRPVVSQYIYRSNANRAAEAQPSEHPLDLDRALNYVCWLYGSNPDTFDFLEEMLDEGGRSSVGCPDEYLDLMIDWSDRLEPYWFEWEEGR